MSANSIFAGPFHALFADPPRRQLERARPVVLAGRHPLSGALPGGGEDGLQEI
jgi:hypothetical protein